MHGEGYHNPIPVQVGIVQKYILCFQNLLIYITISIFMSVHPYACVPSSPIISCYNSNSSSHTSKYHYIKVAWYALRVRSMHSWSPLDPLGPWGEEKQSYVHYNIQQGEAKLCKSKLTLVCHYLPSVGSKQLWASARLGSTGKAGTSLWLYNPRDFWFVVGMLFCAKLQSYKEIGLNWSR